MDDVVQARHGGDPIGQQDGGAPAREELPQPWRAIALATWAYALGYAVWRLAMGRSAQGTLENVIVFLPIYVAPAAACLGAARARSGRAQRGWSVLASAWIISFLGGLLSATARFVAAPEVLRGLADVLYGLFYPTTAAGLALLASSPRTVAGRGRIGVEALVAAVAAHTLVWYFVLRHVPWPTGDALITSIGATVAIVAGAITLHGGRPDGLDMGLRLVGVATVACAASDLAGSQAVLVPGSNLASVSDSVLALSAAVAATGAALRHDASGQEPLLGRYLRIAGHIPNACVALVGGLLLAELRGAGQPGSPIGGLAAGAVALLALVVVRLVLIQRELELEWDRQVTQDARLRHTQKMVALGQLAASVAHDFNNILAAQMGGIADLKDRLPDAPELREIETAARRGRDLCRWLLDFGRLAPEKLSDFDLREIVDELAPLLRRLLPRSIELEPRGVPGAAWARADRTQVEVVVMNLVLNARDAMPEGGRIVLEASSARLNGREAAALTVIDTGRGMDRATLARATDAFFTTKSKGAGTGLGLATVQSIVTGLRGKVRIESEPGRGTSVTCVFPGGGPTPPRGGERVVRAGGLAGPAGPTALPHRTA